MFLYANQCCMPRPQRYRRGQLRVWWAAMDSSAGTTHCARCGLPIPAGSIRAHAGPYATTVRLHPPCHALPRPKSLENDDIYARPLLRRNGLLDASVSMHTLPSGDACGGKTVMEH